MTGKKIQVFGELRGADDGTGDCLLQVYIEPAQQEDAQAIMKALPEMILKILKERGTVTDEAKVRTLYQGPVEGKSQ